MLIIVLYFKLPCIDSDSIKISNITNYLIKANISHIKDTNDLYSEISPINTKRSKS